jgi:hypothetical protein
MGGPRRAGQRRRNVYVKACVAVWRHSIHFFAGFL